MQTTTLNLFGAKPMLTSLAGAAGPVIPARLEGDIQLSAVIDGDGTLMDILVVKGNLTLAPAAVEAVKRWIYGPNMAGGKPLSVSTRIKVNFAM